MKILNLTPVEVLANIIDEVGRKLTEKIFAAFLDNGLSYKAILIRNNYYRTYFFIKKGKVNIVELLAQRGTVLTIMEKSITCVMLCAVTLN